MDARWYAPNLGRFTSQDLYAGDTYNPQSLNRYSYVMNNPVNMWDPTGHVPEWVGSPMYCEFSEDKEFLDLYYLVYNYNSSPTDWYYLGQTQTKTEIKYEYQAIVDHEWVYRHTYTQLNEKDDIYYQYNETYDVYNRTDYYYKEIVVTAEDKAHESEQYINNLAGDPPKNTDHPEVSISTLKVGKGPVQLLDPDKVIMSTGKEPGETQNLITGAVQLVLNDIMNKTLAADESYGGGTAEAVAGFQKASQLTANGVLDVKTFYQMENIYGQYCQYNELLSYPNSNREELSRKLNELLEPYRENEDEGTGNDILSEVESFCREPIT